MYTVNTSNKRSYSKGYRVYKSFSNNGEIVDLVDPDVKLYETIIPISNYTISNILFSKRPKCLVVKVGNTMLHENTPWNKIITTDTAQINIDNNTSYKFPLGIDRENPFPLYQTEIRFYTSSEIVVHCELNTIEEIEMVKLKMRARLGTTYCMFDIIQVDSDSTLTLPYTNCIVKRISFKSKQITFKINDYEEISTNDIIVESFNAIERRDELYYPTYFLTITHISGEMGFVLEDKELIVKCSSPIFLWISVPVDIYNGDNNEENQ